jgi:small subunit ribosomal protein S16
MSVRIRLKRTGTRNNSCFRVVVVDQRATRDGKSIEEVGFYDPRHKNENIDLERVDYWVSNGAQPSETVDRIIARAKAGIKLSEIVKPKKLSKKAQAKAEEAKNAAAEEKAE